MKKPKADEQIKQTYSIWYDCSNCGYHFQKDFEFGQRAGQGECPHCGVSPRQPEWEHRMKSDEITCLNLVK